jgi:hypothetical protein
MAIAIEDRLKRLAFIIEKGWQITKPSPLNPMTLKRNASFNKQ